MCLFCNPPLLIISFDLKQHELQHFGREVAGNHLSCIQQCFSRLYDLQIGDFCTYLRLITGDKLFLAELMC